MYTNKRQYFERTVSLSFTIHNIRLAIPPQLLLTTFRVFGVMDRDPLYNDIPLMACSTRVCFTRVSFISHLPPTESFQMAPSSPVTVSPTTGKCILHSCSLEDTYQVLRKEGKRKESIICCECMLCEDDCESVSHVLWECPAYYSSNRANFVMQSEASLEGSYSRFKARSI